MKWILTFSFLSLNLIAQAKLSDLPADVQKEIKMTEDTQSTVLVNQASNQKEAMTENKTAVTENKLAVVENKIAVNEEKPGINKATAREIEIPLSLETTKKAVAGESTYFRIVMVVALIGILACGILIFVRKAKFTNIKRNKNEIKVLAQHYLGPKKSLAVVRVAGESILVGITDTQINMIKTLSLMDDELPDVTGQNFQSELSTRMTQENENAPVAPARPSATYNRKSQVNTKVSVSDDEMDEFSIRGIKDLVSSKLKNMRSI